MRILFLHLSDIHIAANQKIDNNIIDNLVQALNCLNEFDECMLMVTGDLAYSGLINEFKIGGFFVGSIIKKIREKYKHLGYVKVCIVPGNHDLDFQNLKRDRKEILNLLKTKQIEEYIDEELIRFKNFFEFAERNNCFKNNKLIDIINYNLSGYKIQINLINSELFSTFKDENSDDDKGLHYLPVYEIEKLRRNNNSDLVITLAHRSPEWFELESGRKLKDFLQKYSDIIFLGHEHVNNINLLDNTFNSYAKGMNFVNYTFSFSTIILDTVSKKCSACLFDWDDKKGIFKKIEEKNEKIKFNGPWNLKPKYEYLRDLDSDEKDMSIRRYYVFSGVEKKKENDENDLEEIIEWNEFIKLTKNHKHVVIEGNDLSGKTTLLKQIYIELQKEMIPIFLSIDDLNLKNNNNIINQLDKVIRNAFNDQYENSDDFIKFEQLDKNQKIILIDDYDKIKEKYIGTITDYFNSKFEYLIVSCNSQQNIDIIESIKDRFSGVNQSKNLIRFKLLPFYANKRKELIQKYYEANKVSNYDSEKEIDSLNNFIKNQLKIFDLNPGFITMYVNYCMQTRELESTSNIFGKVFENNLVNAIRRHTSDSNLEEYSVVLEEIAFYIHFKECYPISIDDISKVIMNYNEEYSIHVNVQKFLYVMQEAKILKCEDNYYKFINNNILAYFVAKSLNSRLQNGIGRNELDIIMKNICFNINGDILLFLSYISNNFKILELLKEITISHMENWEEFNFDINNIKFILGNSKEIFIDLPSDIDREKQETKERKEEKRIVSRNNDNIVKNLYDYDKGDIDTEDYKLGQAFQYTNLIAKILPNFNHRLHKDQKKIYIDLIYRYPNKIIYRILYIIDKNFGEIVDNLYNFFVNIGISKISKEKISKAFINEAEVLIISILSHYTALCSNEKTISSLTKYDCNNTNYLLQKMLMNHHVKSFSEFSKIANNIYDKTEKSMIKSMVKRVVYRHFINNRSLKMIGPVAAFAQKYFNTSDKRKFLK